MKAFEQERWMQNVLKDSARTLLKLWEYAEPAMLAKHGYDLMDAYRDDCECLSNGLLDLAALLPDASASEPAEGGPK